MTKQEKIIVSTYTGVLMCDFDDVHEYIQKKLGRPVYTHELADKGIQKEVKEKSREDFLEICNREESEQNWIPCSERMPEPRVDVWCYSDMGEMVGYYDEYIDAWYGRDYLELIVTAWMPLPKQYKGNKNE